MSNIHLNIKLPDVTSREVVKEIKQRYPDYNIITGAHQYQKLYEVVLKQKGLSVEKRTEVCAKIYLSLLITEAITVTALN